MPTKEKTEPPPTRDVNRDSGTASANGGWLRRFVGFHSVFLNISGLLISVRKNAVPPSASGDIVNSMRNVAVSVVAATHNRKRIAARAHPRRVITFCACLTMRAIEIMDGNSEKVEICVSHSSMISVVVRRPQQAF